MIKALKRNQIIIFAIAIMLITAGYLNYTMQTEETAQTSEFMEKKEIAGIGDAKLVSSNNVVAENSLQNNININNNTTETSTEVSTKTVENTDEYFAESRLEREKMYSEMLESYQKIISSNNISEEQKNTSQIEISNINKQKNAIMIAENLIKNKGFKDVIIFSNNGSISVVVKKENLEEADIAQIQSIIQRELNAKVENIHISNKL